MGILCVADFTDLIYCNADLLLNDAKTTDTFYCLVCNTLVDGSDLGIVGTLPIETIVCLRCHFVSVIDMYWADDAVEYDWKYLFLHFPYIKIADEYIDDNAITNNNDLNRLNELNELNELNQIPTRLLIRGGEQNEILVDRQIPRFSSTQLASHRNIPLLTHNMKRYNSWALEYNEACNDRCFNYEFLPINLQDIHFN